MQTVADPTAPSRIVLGDLAFTLGDQQQQAVGSLCVSAVTLVAARRFVSGFDDSGFVSCELAEAFWIIIPCAVHSCQAHSPLTLLCQSGPHEVACSFINNPVESYLSVLFDSLLFCHLLSFVSALTRPLMLQFSPASVAALSSPSSRLTTVARSPAEDRLALALADGTIVLVSLSASVPAAGQQSAAFREEKRITVRFCFCCCACLRRNL